MGLYRYEFTVSFGHMKRAAFTTVIVVLILSPLFVQAQDIWNLQRCIEYARQNNLSIIQGDLSIDLQQITVKQQDLNRYPTLNGSASHNYNFGRTIDPFTNQYVNQHIQSSSFGLSSGITLFSGRQLQNNLKQSQSDLKVKELDKKVLENNIALQIADAYLQILFNKEQLGIAELQKKSTEAQLEVAEKLYTSGKSDKTDVLNQQSQLASDNYNIMVAKNNIRLSELLLKQLLQLDPSTPFEIEIPDINPNDYLASYNLDQILDTAMNTFPEILRAEQALVSADLQSKVAAGGQYPTLRLFGNLNTVYTESNKEKINVKQVYIPIGVVEGSGEQVLSQVTRFDTRTTAFGKQVKNNFGQSAGLSLSVPIFNNYRVKNNMSSAEVNYQIKNVELRLAKTQLTNDVTQAYTSYLAAVEQYRSALANFNAQTESYALNDKRFGAGLMTSAEILLFRNNLNTAEINLNRAKYQLVFSKTQLDFYLGKQLNIQ